MKMWSFIFCSPAALLQSARVAAPNKALAKSLLQSLVQDDVDGDGDANRVIAQHLGETPDNRVRVISAVRRDGVETSFA